MCEPGQVDNMDVEEGQRSLQAERLPPLGSAVSLPPASSLRTSGGRCPSGQLQGISGARILHRISSTKYVREILSEW